MRRFLLAFAIIVAGSASSVAQTATESVLYSFPFEANSTNNVNPDSALAPGLNGDLYSAGSYPITAKYSGDYSDAASTSSAVTVTVK
jgi:hypothetical protein